MSACDSCRIPLGTGLAGPGDKRYCCAGCTAGGPCICTYEEDLSRYPPVQYARPISLTELLDRYERIIEQPSQNPHALTPGGETSIEA
jgi:hypothetical protein